MNNLEIATWGLTIFTGLLVIATGVYAYFTYKMLTSSAKAQKLLEEQNFIAANQNHLIKEQIEESQKQSEALNVLSEAIRLIGPSVIAAQTQKEIRQELAEMQKKNNPQRRALTGR